MSVNSQVQTSIESLIKSIFNIFFVFVLIFKFWRPHGKRGAPFDYNIAGLFTVRIGKIVRVFIL